MILSISLWIAGIILVLCPRELRCTERWWDMWLGLSQGNFCWKMSLPSPSFPINWFLMSQESLWGLKKSPLLGCCKAPEPMFHSYWACALEAGSCNPWVHVPQPLKPKCPRACGLQEGKSPQWEAHAPQLESSRGLPHLEKSPCSNKDPAQAKMK